jgi:hypothetical protein
VSSPFFSKIDRRRPWSHRTQVATRGPHQESMNIDGYDGSILIADLCVELGLNHRKIFLHHFPLY